MDHKVSCVTDVLHEAVDSKTLGSSRPMFESVHFRREIQHIRDPEGAEC